MPINIEPVAIAHTPFAEKFAIPRQPLLAPAAQARIELIPPYDSVHAFDGLEHVSHIWLIFQFHQARNKENQPPRMRVRPPRLGGNEKLGVFASRATHRPNSLGQSVVKLEKVDGTTLHVSGIDLLDGTPIIDIKPYVPYADNIPHASNQIAAQPPQLVTVTWTEQAKLQAEKQAARLDQNVVALIEQCLAQDPKPAYQQPDSERRYGVRFWDLNISWHYPQPDQICVSEISVVADDTHPV